ncbi:involucrin-like [Vigna unguiculata]|uniref:involucrin-like n=1 Tax=Vigna unguiculata TaxID=3917 RepID=UPI0010169985|nr:involucrin-like [Vigna unguiculata]
MASNEEGKISLKYWVDDKKERVIVAEASGELVDVLFSFLTLPLGTIIRLWDTSEQQQRRENTSEQQEGPGCINNLCPSFKDILGLRNNSQQQVGRENISEQLVGRGNTSEEQEGRDNNSEQQQRPDNSSEQQEGRENTSQQQQGRENTSQQQQVEHENTSEQQQRCENTSEQQIGHENNSEQQEGPGCINKLCHSFKDILGLRSKQQVGLVGLCCF